MAKSEEWWNVSELGIVADGNGKDVDLRPYNNYYVSTFGRVYNDKTKRYLPKDGKGYDKDGYRSVTLCSGKKKQIKIKLHRLVAYAFIPNEKKLPQINHLDERTDNNCVSNLEWVTCKENLNYGNHNQRMAESLRISEKAIQARKIKAKNQEKRVKQLTLEGQLIKIWRSAKECSEYGYSFQHISNCCNNSRKTHKGYRWEFL